MKNLIIFFFDGSPKTGKFVLEKAGKNLTPVSLELGGKSPCIIDETADLKSAAKQIVCGKFSNAGQTCAAPDYLLVQHNVKKKLIHYMEKQIQKLYGEDPILDESYPSIINEKHFKRICGLIDRGKVIYGGKTDGFRLKIEPTLMDGVTWDDIVMREEVFGPLLPIVTYYDLREAVSAIKAQTKPLVLYLFTKNKQREAYILKDLSYGKGCGSHTEVHLAVPYFMSGEIGLSGKGKYHGKANFERFAREKKRLKQVFFLEMPLTSTLLKTQLKWIKKWM